jgi:hypothetical protein
MRPLTEDAPPAFHVAACATGAKARVIAVATAAILSERDLFIKNPSIYGHCVEGKINVLKKLAAD